MPVGINATATRRITPVSVDLSYRGPVYRRALPAGVLLGLSLLIIPALHSGAEANVAPRSGDSEKQIVFSSYLGQQPALAGSGYSLYITNGDGTDPRLLYDQQGCDEYHPVYSPDGSQIAFNRCWNIVVAPADDVTPSAMTKLQCPLSWCMEASWSPDGRKLVFAASTERFPPSPLAWDLWVSDSDGSEARQLYAGPGAQRAPSWSPDGRRIAFTNNESGGLYDLDVLSVNLRGRRVRPIANGIATERDAAYSPDGTRIAFARRAKNGYLNLFIKVLASGRVHRLTREETTHMYPSWSPSSRWIDYSRWNMDLGAFEVMKARSDGSGQPIALSNGAGWMSTWRP